MPPTAEAPVAKAAALAPGPGGGSAPMTRTAGAGACAATIGGGTPRLAEARMTMTAAARPVFLAAAN